MVLTGGIHARTKVTKFTKTGQAISLPSLKAGRFAHACGKVIKKDGATVGRESCLHVIHKINVLTIPLQLYIVTGGHSSSNLASTEILKKGGGHSWQTVASLPSGRHHLRGVSLANGHFMVSGEE